MRLVVVRYAMPRCICSRSAAGILFRLYCRNAWLPSASVSRSRRRALRRPRIRRVRARGRHRGSFPGMHNYCTLHTTTRARTPVRGNADIGSTEARLQEPPRAGVWCSSEKNVRTYYPVNNELTLIRACITKGVGNGSARASYCSKFFVSYMSNPGELLKG